MSAKRKGKVIPPFPAGSDNVIAFPAPERTPTIRFHEVATTDEDMDRRFMQLIILLENAARRVQLENQNKGG